MKTLQVILLTLVITSSLANAKCKNDCEKVHDIIIGGGGFAGIAFTYYADLIKELSYKTGVHLPGSVNLSNVLVLEARSVIGGNARATPISELDPQLVELNRVLYNFTGPFIYDLGPQRVPQLTCKLDRCTAIQSQTIEEETPYYTKEVTRERKSMCPIPNIDNYDVLNPYGIASSCTIDFPFYGDSSEPWSYNNWLGPAFNLTDLQDWAYLDQNGLNAINGYILYDGPNPVTCNSSDASCEECGDCFATECAKYANLKAALLGRE